MKQKPHDKNTIRSNNGEKYSTLFRALREHFWIKLEKKTAQNLPYFSTSITKRMHFFDRNSIL